MRAPRLSWKTEIHDTDILLTLDGIIDENFHYDELIAKLPTENRQPLRVNLKGIKRINSMGIRQWYYFVKNLEWPTPVLLEECSSVFTDFLSNTKEMSQGCQVKSIYMAVWCPECEDDFDVRIDLDENLDLDQGYLCPNGSDYYKPEKWRLEVLMK